MNIQTKKLLLQFDEYDYYEFPKNFDEKDIESRARKVFSEILTIESEIYFEDWVHNQDASFGLAIILKKYQKTEGQNIYQPTILFSNFGNLVTFTMKESLPEKLINKILNALKTNKFKYIDDNELDSPYDGSMQGNETFQTWWDRYFEWL